MTGVDHRGLFDKYEVRRTDGRDVLGDKHHGCTYFVLDLTHDPAARAAAILYADMVRGSRQQLTADLLVKCDGVAALDAGAASLYRAHASVDQRDFALLPEAAKRQWREDVRAVLDALHQRTARTP